MGIIVKTSGPKTLHTLVSGIIHANSRNTNILSQYPVTAITVAAMGPERNRSDAHLEIGNNVLFGRSFLALL